MAVKDIRSNLEQKLVFNAAISTDATTAGSIIDTADFELGLMFAVAVSAFTDGTYTLLLEEDDVIGFTSATTISGDQLLGALPTALAAATGAGAVMETVGVISNKQFVRASIVSASTTTGATVQVIATEKGEYMPVV